MFSYLHLPWQTCLFLAFNLVLLARQINVATADSNSCEERNIPTGMHAIHANLAYLSETFSGVLNRQIRISRDLTDQELERLLVRLDEIAPSEAEDFLDYINSVYEDMVEDWLLRCQAQLPVKRRGQLSVKRSGGEPGGVTEESQDTKVTGETYSLLWSQLKRDDVKHPLYRVPRSSHKL